MLKASINLVQQRWGKLDRRKHSTISITHLRNSTAEPRSTGYDLNKSDTLLLQSAVVSRIETEELSPQWAMQK